MEIGNNLKKLRANKNMTQKELAEALNVSYQAVSRWENNEVEPDISTLSKLSQIFGVSVDQIINGDVDKPKEEETPKEEVAAVAATVAVVAAAKQEKKIVKYCYSCHEPIYEGDPIKQLNRKFPDGHVESHDICEKCFNQKKVSEKVKCELCGLEVEKSSSKTIEIRHVHSNGRHRVSKTDRKVVCKDCFAEQMARGNTREVSSAVAPTASSSKPKKVKEPMGPKRLIFGLLFGLVTLVTLMVVFFTSTSFGTAASIFIPILLGYGVFATIYCLFTDCYIGELFVDIASFSIKMPGIIFTFDLDGLAFLIVMKILFAIIGVFVGIAVLLFAIAVSMALSIVTFPFVAHKESI